MTAESGKILAGIGSIFMALNFASIIGFILVFLGMRDLSEHYKDPKIIDGVLTGAIFGVIGAVLGTLGIIFCFTIIGAIIGIPLIIVGFVFELLMASRFKKALYAMADRSSQQLFRTAGTLIWYGALLSIIVVGFFLIWIAFIILAVAFLTLKIVPLPPQSYQTPQDAPASNIKANFCTNCGNPVSSEATFCSHCGKQI